MDCTKYLCSFLQLFLKWQNPSDATVMMTFIDYHSFYHHHQFAPFDGLCPRTGKPLGEVQFTSFKNLHVQHQATWLHMQELDPVSPRVDKHIDTTVKNLLFVSNLKGIPKYTSRKKDAPHRGRPAKPKTSVLEH